MRIQSANGLATRSVVLALTAALLSACTLEQVMIGQWYTIYTPQAGACPSLEWRFVVDPQRSINGSLSTNAPQQSASLSGQLGPDDSFQMTATNAATHQTANLTGHFTSLVSTMSIHGTALGSACDGQTLKMRLGRYFSFQGGGFGGGGGGSN